MIKATKLKQGDTIAIVSPSSGLAGEPHIRWRTQQGIERIEALGYRVKVMDNSLNGIEWNFTHPKERAEILTAAFADLDVQAILCTIGGYESVRIIPFLDDEVLRQHPKIFIGYSDISPLHLHMYKLGITSFYGPALLTDFAENVALDTYTVDHLFSAIGEAQPIGAISTSDEVRVHGLRWDEDKRHMAREKIPNGDYMHISGRGTVEGQLIGGCFESLDKLRGTPYFPDLAHFKDKILFLETSEVQVDPMSFEETLRAFGLMGIYDVVAGILFGRPQNGVHQDAYHDKLRLILAEFHQETIPVLGNASFGHNEPKCTLPYGVQATLSADALTFSIGEAAIVD
ncbi:S66 family peptidase [Staphylococcus intermedius]|uniref:S66 family peptidase n=1 Tax=Staphylococcus intermedius TaxID=1285 RepID=UPI000BBCF08D|nr:S66 peptidase family protein [Staphylococcus intermedius]PCF88318.1 LD-carboxypeptidase [Staphylococcus intermedius]